MSQELPVSTSEEKFKLLDRRDKLMRTYEVIVLFLLILITMFSLFRLNQIAASNQKNIKEHTEQIQEVGDGNRARLDINLCIVSVPPQTRTPEYVHNCYTAVEKLYQVNVARYGYGKD